MPRLVTTQIPVTNSNKPSFDDSSTIETMNRCNSCFSEDFLLKSNQAVCNIQSIEKKTDQSFFPHNLMEMLSSPFFEDCLSWKSDGKAFSIIDTAKFVAKDKVFNSLKTERRHKSFVRKLNRWGFRMDLSKGPNCGFYSHPLFRRDEPWLCKKMRCESRKILSNFQAKMHAEAFLKTTLRGKFYYEKQAEPKIDMITSNIEFAPQKISYLEHEEARQNYFEALRILRNLPSGKRLQYHPIEFKPFPSLLVNTHNAIVNNALRALATENCKKWTPRCF